MASISSMVHKVACLMLMMMMIMVSNAAKADVSCNDAVSAVATCVPYITKSGSLSSDCCTGISNLYAEANTTPERQSVCKCLENAIKAVPSFDAGLLLGLPDKCGINIPYKISTSTNCSSVK